MTRLHDKRTRPQKKRGFTIVEILVVITVIALLTGFMMVAVSSARKSANSLKTSSKLKQSNEWMQLWSGSHQNNILPSQFDHTHEVTFAGADAFARMDEHVGDDNPDDNLTRGQYQGTWSDLLWADNSLHTTYGLADYEEEQDDDSQWEEGHLRWSTDSPDNDIYELYDSFDHPFRSSFMNTRGSQKGLPGYFAANDFFDSRSAQDVDISADSRVDRYYTYAMMYSPSTSVYLVDSVAGETIGDEAEPWAYDFDITSEGQLIDPLANTTGEVDFRYGKECYLLLLDGSTARVAPWSERGPEENPTGGADVSLYGMGYRVHQLTNRKATTD